MNKLAHILTITMIASISAVTSCMNNRVVIKTADNQDCKLPQWKIEASRLLHTKQELQAFKEKYSGAIPAPITLKTISSEKLYLFSNVLDEHDIPTYVKRLRPKKKNLLLHAVRPQELDSPYIMCELLKTYFPQDFIEEHINPHFPTIEVVNCLQGLIIRDNCEHKKFTQTRIKSYGDDSYLRPSHYGGYNYLPRILFTQSNFSGLTLPLISTLSDESNDQWLFENCTNADKQKIYVLTPMKPVDENKRFAQTDLKENKKKLWAMPYEGSTILEKIIEHTNAIENSAFSNNGKYLATASTDRLILTDLTIKNDMFVGLDTLLTGHTGSIRCICFNKQSTILAATSENNIYFWDTQKCALLAKLECPAGIADTIQFNHNDSRLITIAFDEISNNSFITLWDVIDITKSIIIKNHVFNYTYARNPTFTPSGDNIIIETAKQIIVLNGWSGELIMKTAPSKMLSVNAVLMNYQPILVTTTRNDNHNCNVALWDIKSKKCIATILENEENLLGIGVSGSRYVISTNAIFGMIKTAFYNDNDDDCLNWTLDKSNLLQRYFLRRLYYAHKQNDPMILHPDSPEYRTLQNLPTEPCNVKAMVENYLLNVSSS